MIRNALLLIGLIVLTVAASGCRAGGAQSFGQQFGQSDLGSQVLQGFQQPILGGNAQQVGGNLPNAQQAQGALEQFGRNLGSRFSNGILNQGVNQVINGLFQSE